MNINIFKWTSKAKWLKNMKEQHSNYQAQRVYERVLSFLNSP